MGSSSYPHLFWWMMCAVLVWTLGCGDDNEKDDGSGLEAATPAALTEALVTAESGAVITLTGARYDGNFKVPAGVSIVGNGAMVVGSDASAVFQVTGGAGDTATRLSNLHIENNGLAVVASGGGSVVFEDLSIDTTAVGGVFVDGLEALSLTRVVAVGSLNANNISELGTFNGFAVDANRFPIAGVFVLNVAQVAIEGLTLSGFAGFGAIFKDCQGSWRTGSILDFVGTGVLVEGGNITLEALEIGDSLRTNNLVLATNGIAVTQEAVVTSQDVDLRNIFGLGLLQNNAISAHTNFNARAITKAGVWVQHAPGDADRPALRIAGQSVVENNFGLGVYLNDFGGVDLDGLTITNTAQRQELLGELGTSVIGDGIQMKAPSKQIRIVDTQLSGNARIGWLLDGAESETYGPLSFELDLGIDQGALLDVSNTYGLITQNLDDLSIVGENGRLEAPDFEAQDNRARETGLRLGTVSDLERFVGVGAAVRAGLIGNDGLVDVTGQLVEGSGRIDEFGIVGENGR